MSLDLQDVKFPSLILGLVCHASQVDMGPFRTGVEFVVREQSADILPSARRRDLPGAVFDYSDADRVKLNEEISTWPSNMEFI